MNTMNKMLSIHPENPELRKIRQVVACLKDGGVIIYPTDTIYGLGCDMTQPKAIERIYSIRNMDPPKALLTLICSDISQVAQFARHIDNEVFRLMKRNLPGPFTFILSSGNQLPRTLKNRKGTIGVRIPDHPITQAILAELDGPLLSASLHSDDTILEYENDPQEILPLFQNEVDLIVDGGIGARTPSTVVDCTTDEPLIIRDGAGLLRL